MSFSPESNPAKIGRNANGNGYGNGYGNGNGIEYGYIQMCFTTLCGEFDRLLYGAVHNLF